MRFLFSSLVASFAYAIACVLNALRFRSSTLGCARGWSGVNRVVPGGNGPLRVRRHLPQPLPPEGGALTDDLYDLYDIFPLHDLDLSGQIDVFPICSI